MRKFAMGMNCTSVMELWRKYGGRIRQVVRFGVLLTCTIVVVIQLYECFYKLWKPPVTSFSRVVVNDSMTFPAVTICHYPAYKPQILQKYNLQNVRANSEYVNFPFENATLLQLWEEATYSKDEVLGLVGLSSSQFDIEVRSTFSVVWGQCHTVLPLVQTKASGRDKGYSIVLKEIGGVVEDTRSEDDLGWYVFLHSTIDPWIEHPEELAGSEESIFVKEGEEVHVKIGVQEYHEVDKGDDRCNNSYDYSSVQCEQLCKTEQLVREVGCIGPWLIDIGAPLCSDFKTTDALLMNYLYVLSCEETCRECMRPCHSLQFTPYIMRRNWMYTNGHKLSHLYIYYTSRRVELSEESLAYDWSQFLADLGGSLGFLLGLSVLGIIGIMERLIEMIFSSVQSPRSSQTLLTNQRKNNVLELMDKVNNHDVNSEMDCVCCRSVEEKNLNIHNSDTLRVEDKFHTKY